MTANYSLERLLEEFPSDNLVARLNIVGAHARGRKRYSFLGAGRHLYDLDHAIQRMQARASEDSSYVLPYFKARAEVAGLADAAVAAGNQDLAARAYQIAGI